MKQKMIDKIHGRIIRRLRARYTMVKPEPAGGVFNFRCHENCVQYVRDRPGLGLGIVETIYIEDNNTPVLHYLVHDPVANKYLEVTLGWRAPLLEYYVIRPVHESDWNNILREFNRSLDDWRDEFVGWFGRKVLRIGRVL